jgi:sperm-associated antigen 16 protein
LFLFLSFQVKVLDFIQHPQATASDDNTWRMWHVPDGDLIMSGEGHKDWVGGIDFHPRGIGLASASGDATIKIWDFAQQACVATLTEHTAAVWSVAFHDMGEFLASCSLDHCIRLWDVEMATCKSVLPLPLTTCTFYQGMAAWCGLRRPPPAF